MPKATAPKQLKDFSRQHRANLRLGPPALQQNLEPTWPVFCDRRVPFVRPECGTLIEDFGFHLKATGCTEMIVFLVVSAGAFARGNADFRSIMPRDWMFAPDEQTRGTRFVSPDGSAWLSLYRMPAAREPIAVHMDAVRTVKDGRITYVRREPTWIVVSGFKGDRIFYRKAILACGNAEWHQLDFEYPVADKLA